MCRFLLPSQKNTIKCLSECLALTNCIRERKHFPFSHHEAVWLKCCSWGTACTVFINMTCAMVLATQITFTRIPSPHSSHVFEVNQGLIDVARKSRFKPLLCLSWPVTLWASYSSLCMVNKAVIPALQD